MSSISDIFFLSAFFLMEDDDVASVLFCFAQWGQYRHKSLWPAQLTQKLMPVISAQMDASRCVSLPEILSNVKRFHNAGGIYDMLNLKAYIDCFTDINHFTATRKGKRVDLYTTYCIPPPPPTRIMSPVRSPVSTMDNTFMTQEAQNNMYESLKSLTQAGIEHACIRTSTEGIHPVLALSEYYRHLYTVSLRQNDARNFA